MLSAQGKTSRYSQEVFHDSQYRFSPRTTRVLRLSAAAMALGALLAPDTALAEDAPSFLSQQNGDIIWTMLGAMLVMFMQPGFALVECGLTRAKNAGNILMKNFVDFSVGTPLFFLLGFGLMFGASNGFIGSPTFGMSFIDPTTPEGGWAWNSLFADTKGWLENLGFIDFAGSTVVHSVGGWVGLAGAICVGPRIGKYAPDGKSLAIPGHNIPLVALGVFILWFAWFGFNCGSTTTPDGTVGYIAVNTCLAACTGFASALLTIWFITDKPDPSMAMNGVLAGLVGVTAGCFEVSPVGSIFIGIICGIAVVFSILFIDQKLHIDDPVGAVSVHGVCGFLGTVLVGLFAAPGYGSNVGLFYGGGVHLLLVQLLGAVSVGAWAFITGLLAFKLADKVIGLRVSREVELKGLDITEHGADVYSGFQIFSNE